MKSPGIGGGFRDRNAYPGASDEQAPADEETGCPSPVGSPVAHDSPPAQSGIEKGDCHRRFTTLACSNDPGIATIQTHLVLGFIHVSPRRAFPAWGRSDFPHAGPPELTARDRPP